MSDLTYRETAALHCIREYTTRRGYPPSLREIGAATGLTSTSSVAHLLRRLERKGALRLLRGDDSDRVRGIELMP